ncbi:hypothetical protein WN55_03221 [Dufourea novaeangliae]|uniref:Uncharacterized protein n=1 Tax=Dufourea novaeangliae TaxID=178035 RepID=A0A154PLP1_DUFNO|nr:hypothetical protein WN55_03221 [Dufourea novaeangliae]
MTQVSELPTPKRNTARLRKNFIADNIDGSDLVVRINISILASIEVYIDITK